MDSARGGSRAWLCSAGTGVPSFKSPQEGWVERSQNDKWDPSMQEPAGIPKEEEGALCPFYFHKENGFRCIFS